MNHTTSDDKFPHAWKGAVGCFGLGLGIMIVTVVLALLTPCCRYCFCCSTFMVSIKVFQNLCVLCLLCWPKIVCISISLYTLYTRILFKWLWMNLEGYFWNIKVYGHMLARYLLAIKNYWVARNVGLTRFRNTWKLTWLIFS